MIKNLGCRRRERERERGWQIRKGEIERQRETQGVGER